MSVLVDAAVVGERDLDSALDRSDRIKSLCNVNSSSNESNLFRKICKLYPEVFHDGRQGALELVDEVEADSGAVGQANLSENQRSIPESQYFLFANLTSGSTVTFPTLKGTSQLDQYLRSHERTFDVRRKGIRGYPQKQV